MTHSRDTSHSSSTPEGGSITGGISSSVTTPPTELGRYRADKDVAVVGMACRVAGGNNSPEQLWEFLLQKKDASGELPSVRWEPYLRRDPRNSQILARTTSRGYFLKSLEDFDAQFFGISPKEAEQMDPQQRISLEVAYEALEDAGIPSKSLSGSDTAVFWGVNSDDYSKLLLEDLPNIEAWMGIGTAYCGVPNRISYHFNLVGPSTAVDAACASSLVAVHHGIQAIVLGESKLAIVGGVNAICGPGLSQVLDRAGAVSSEGKCRSFDDSAQGYGRGEGAAAIILKNMSQAIEDGDHIICVVKGTAVAQDGKTNGIMAPSQISQQLVAQKALQVADTDPLGVGYVEAHATSTPLGDPTEISAISEIYGKNRRDGNPCFVGSIKPNIGHLEAGAGAVGFIKAAMALKRGVIPPQANLKILNRKINWKTSKLKVVQEVTKWANPDTIRRAAVCSYGYGGTVSHAVLEEYHPPEPPRLSTSSQLDPFLPSVILLSGSQKKRYRSQAQLLSEWMKSSDPAQNIEGIACTLATRRDHHDYRVGIISDDLGDAINQLESLSQAATSPWICESRVLATDIKKDVVWVFSGHGAQWPDMGKELLGNPIFYRSIQPLDCLVQDEIGISPVDLLRSGNFESSDQVQILTYFMQIGISAVLNSYGIFPQAVIGHSVGEIAASVVAGALTPEEGTIIIIRRSILYRQVMGQGGMLLVNRPTQEISGLLEGISNLCIGIHSSPSSCVVSGSAEAISQASDMFKQASIKVLRVKTDIAFHSPSLNKLRQPLLDSLRNSLLPTSPSSVKLYSTSLKDPRGQDLRDSTYWANNMVKPVHLTSAIQAAVEDSFRIFLEISSHPLVSHSINETLMDASLEDYAVVPTITREKPSLKSILYSVAQLHCKGVSVDWKSIMPRNWADGVPKTIWMHRPVWRKVETGNIQVQQTHVPDKHTLLGHRVSVAGTDGFIFNTHLDQDSKPFPGSHPLHGTEIVPAAGLLNTFLKATGANVLTNTILRVPVAINAPRSVQVVSFGNDIKISSKLIQDSEANPHEDSWVTHTTAKWEIADLNFRTQGEVFDITGTRSRIGSRLADNFTVDYLAKVGVSAMGFPWIVTEHYGDTREMLAHVDTAPGITIDAGVPWDPTSWAPILDAATSVGSTLFFDEPRLRMPAQVDRVDLFTPNNPPKLAWLYVCAATETHMASDVSIIDSKGVTLARISGMRFSEIEGTPGASGSMENLVHHIAWPPALPAEDPFNFDQLIIICQDVYLSNIYSSTLPQKIKVLSFISSCDFSTAQLSLSSASAIVYIPNRISTLEDVPKGSEESTWELLEIIKFVAKNKLPTKVFVVTRSTLDAETVIALAHAPLIGLSRILASEHGDIFGGLIDTEVDKIPLTEMRYIQGADIIRVQDGVARTAALRPLPRQRFLGPSHANKLLPRPGGTYLITGGFGALGLEVADFLVEKGARRIILNSRRSLPPRREWNHCSDDIMPVISRIRLLEDKGASVHVISIDISVPSASKDLTTALENLRLPPVRGVVHAAGVLDNQLALDTTRSAFSRVLDPKITGSLVLHTVFPPQSVDFFILFSSCGQLIGFTGQSSYGSANSFLDALAMHRRLLGDISVSFQWTSWRGMGMGASTEYIKAELESKGITDVTRDEAFSAWSHLAKYDIDHGVILRSLTFDEGEPAPCAILRDIAIRRIGNSANEDMTKTIPLTEDLVPPSGPELKKYLDVAIRKCVAQVLHMDPNEVDSKAALADLGVDSVLTVSLRRQLQQSLKIKVPPTLIWSHPTVNHLVEWFGKRIS